MYVWNKGKPETLNHALVEFQKGAVAANMLTVLATIDGLPVNFRSEIAAIQMGNRKKIG